jgi:3-dehydroquinate synthase
MQTLQQEFQICFRYPVHFTTDLFAPENLLFAQVLNPAPTPWPPPPVFGGGGQGVGATAGQGVGAVRKVLFVIDEGVNQHHPGLLAAIETYCREHRISLAGPPRRVPGGERVKNEHEWVLTLHHAIERAGLCRHSFLAAIGGGAVLDMAGLAAATAHRGVRLLRIPTTVLSQNDSGVGVKNGVNAFGKKNFLGTFAPPYAVLNDSRFLTTLSDRDWRSGIAEAIKVALIQDAAFFEWLEQHAAGVGVGVGVRVGSEHLDPTPTPTPTPTPSRDLDAMQRLIYRCAELHLRHIATSGDPFELGSARPLDFGHWAAHKLEQLSGYRLRHGEAVAIGIALDSTYSYLTGLFPEPDWRRVLRLLQATGFAIHAPELSEHRDDRRHPRCLLQGLREFREHLGGELTVTLLNGIGHGLEVHEINEPRMVESIALLERMGKGVGCSVFGVGYSVLADRTDPSDPSDPSRTPNPPASRVPEHPTPNTEYPCRAHLSRKGEAIWKPTPRRPRARAR